MNDIQMVKDEFGNEPNKPNAKVSVKAIIAKLFGTIGITVMSLIIFFLLIIIKNPIVQFIGNTAVILLCIILTKVLLYYKKEDAVANSIFTPIILLSCSASFFWIVFSTEKFLFWPLLFVLVIGYYFYFIHFEFHKLHFNNIVKLLCSSTCSFFVFAYSSIISNHTIGFIFTAIFIFLILKSDTYDSQKTIIKLINCAILLFIITLCGSSTDHFIVPIVSICLFIYSLIIKNKRFWIYPLCCFPLFALHDILFIIPSAILLTIGVIHFGRKWLTTKGNLYHVLYLFISTIVIGSIVSFLTEYEFLLASVFLIFATINTIYLYKTCVKQRKLVHINFNVISLLLIQLFISYCWIDALVSGYFDDATVVVGSIVLLVTLLPSTIYHFRYKQSNPILLVWQHLKWGTFLFLVIGYFTYEYSYILSPILFSTSFFLIFTSLNFKYKKICRASVISSAILGLITLFFLTKISTIWHLISFGIFASIMIVGFVFVWKYVDRELKEKLSTESTI